jgi:hypothetical protein
MSLNIANRNLSTINGLTDDTLTSGYITINNTIKIPSTPIQTGNTLDNSTAAIFLKDNSSNGFGTFYPISTSNSSGIPELFFNGNVFITTANLLNEFETITANYPVDFSNIMINGGYTNFQNSAYPNSNIGDLGTGFRYSVNGTMQFRNFNTGWIDLVDITKHDQFAELIDVDVHTNPLQNNQYIIYNSTSNLFVNANLAILNDTQPMLGGDLAVNGHNMLMNTGNLSIIDINNNKVLELRSKSTYDNIGTYVRIENNDVGSGPIVTVDGLVDADIGLTLQSKGTGNINLNATEGHILLNSDSINVSGYTVNSIYRTSYQPGGYQPSTVTNVPISSDTILFNFDNTSTVGTYWANVSVGVDGQKLNLIYNNSNISGGVDVLVDFGNEGLITGGGFAQGIHFDTSGQSSTLIYLDADINKWQILNTGGGIF